MRRLGTAGLLLLSVLCACTKPAEPPAAPAPPPPAPKPAPVETVKADWPTFHGSYNLDGASDIAFPDNPVQKWRADFGAPILNPPVAQGNLIFAATRGTVRAVDLAGKDVWTRTFEEPATPTRRASPMFFDAPLALFESTLIACAAGGQVYALDAATGETRWETDTTLPILGSPNFVPGSPPKVMIIDQSIGILHALDFATGKPLWKGPEIARCDASPAVSGDAVSFGSCAGAVHIFSAQSGQMVHEINIDEQSQVAGGVVIVGDSVYASTRSGTFINANVKTGKVIWTNADCEGEGLGTPAVRGDYVVFTANDGVLYALDRASGQLKWRDKLRGEPTSPIIVGDKVAACSRGTVYLYRLSGGQRLWSYEVSDEVTAPIVAGKLLVVGSEDGSLVAFGEG